MTQHDSCGLFERFLRGLDQSADRPALRLGGDTLTYRELHEQALTWAGSLGDAKVVGVLAGKTPTAYAGILGALCAGATVVPLHPDFPAARTRHMLELSGATAVIADERGRAVLASLGDGAPPVIEPRPDRALTRPRPVGPDDTAYMLFTSGSTGRPKGVPISHGSTHHYFRLLDARYGFAPTDVFTQTFDLNFDCAMFDLFCAWGSGATVDVTPQTAYLDLPSYLSQHGITVWFATPSAISLVRRMGGLTPGALPGLRWSFFAGEALRCHDATDWQTAAPASTLENIYGPTELTVTITGHRWDPAGSPERAVNGLVPIGRVHADHDHVLVDEQDRETPVEGELLITGPQMSVGYLDPSDDEGRFVERDGRRWYRTGDRVRRLPDGELVYLGRLDSQVQVQGWRVELAEVEHELRTCDGVQDAVAVGAATASGTELVVYYTGEPRPAAHLAQALRELLPKGMLPRRFEHLPEFPLNSNRKVDRKELTRRAEELLTRRREGAAV
ncbi:AMP-binding protein [Streptomyces alanosinicus]|uniref:Amino acid adenylation protein n=1 Tax=Streptomyces alanosinicus TaxID=68171 RepID=A0A919D810_9ACTN|nr:AMP-binding protein [Streptomyces alanosinicus]GHE14172.1 amino acid adenylation protein [Streptomyces alanosinicus]